MEAGKCIKPIDETCTEDEIIKCSNDKEVTLFKCVDGNSVVTGMRCELVEPPEGGGGFFSNPIKIALFVGIFMIVLKGIIIFVVNRK